MSRNAKPSRGLEQIAAALEYIEERLRQALRIEDAALIARYSPYHFWRVFHGLTGETPGDYIRRRRLTCAARELTGGSRRILDIALDWGFDSQAAFTRAFKLQFRRPPAAYRRAGHDRLDLERAAWTPASFAHVGEGGVSLRPRLAFAGPFAIAGFEAAIDFQDDPLDSGGHGGVYQLWKSLLARRHLIRGRVAADLFYELCRFESSEPKPGGGVTSETRFLKLVGQEVPAAAADLDELPAGMVLRRLPRRRYAIFVHEGPIQRIQASCDYIYGVWARETDLRLTPGDEIQLFDRRRFPGVGAGSFEIYVPIEDA
ncbi:MAG: helix-turn-helix domain-containing protein [Leptospirales bacterium]|jgi:AraC family transcriptional regulator